MRCDPTVVSNEYTSRREKINDLTDQDYVLQTGPVCAPLEGSKPLGTFGKNGVEGVSAARSIERLTFDFGPGHDLTVHEIKPHIRLCADSNEPAWDSLSLSLSAPPLLTLSVSQDT